jgi:hypothetical protein
VQRHGHGLEVPRPADVREHDLHPRVPGRDAVEQDRPGEVDPQALPARLARAQPARPRVREQHQAELGGGVEERQEAVVPGVEGLHRRVQLQPPQPQRRELRQPLQRVLAVRVHAAEPDEPPVGTDPRDLGVVERPAARVPPEQHADHVQALVQRGELLQRRRLRPLPEVPLDRVRVVPHAPAHPIPGRQVHMHVDRAHPDNIKGLSL